MEERKRDRIEIKRKQGKIVSVLISPSSKYVNTLMSEHYVQLDFVLENPIAFKVGDYIEDEIFGKFVIKDEQMPADEQGSGGYRYSLKFEAWYRLWGNKKHLLVVEPVTTTDIVMPPMRKEINWNLTQNLEEQAKEVVRNLMLLGYVPQTTNGEPTNLLKYISIKDSAVKRYESHNMSFNGADIISVLGQLADTWECEWWITKRNGLMPATEDDFVINFGKCEEGKSYEFARFGNVESMSISKNQDTYANKFYVFGSQDNMPLTYRKQLVLTATIHDDNILLMNRALLSDMFRSHYSDRVEEFPAVGSWTWDKNPTTDDGSFPTLSDGSKIYSEYEEMDMYNSFRVRNSRSYRLNATLTIGQKTIITHPYNSTPLINLNVTCTYSVKLKNIKTNKVIDICEGETIDQYRADTSIHLFPSNANLIDLSDGGLVGSYLFITKGATVNIDIPLELEPAEYRFVLYQKVSIESMGVNLNPYFANYLIEICPINDKYYDYIFESYIKGYDYSGFNGQMVASTRIEEEYTKVVKCYVEGVTYWLRINAYEEDTKLKAKYCKLLHNVVTSEGDDEGEELSKNELENLKIEEKHIRIDEDYCYDVPIVWYSTIYDNPSSLLTIGSVRLQLPLNDNPDDKDFVDSTGKWICLNGCILPYDYRNNPDALSLVEMGVIFDGVYPDGRLVVKKVLTQEKRQETKVDDDNSKQLWDYNSYHLALERLDLDASRKTNKIVSVPFSFSNEYRLNDAKLELRFLPPQDAYDFIQGDYYHMPNNFKLSGMTFEVVFKRTATFQEHIDDMTSSITNSKGDYEIVRNNGFGSWLPNNILKPYENDPCVLVGWNVNKIQGLGLVEDAEKRLMNKGFEYAQAMEDSQFTFDCNMMSTFFFEFADSISKYLLDASGRFLIDASKRFVKVKSGTYVIPNIGQRVTINHGALPNGKKMSRIIGMELKLDKPYDTPKITVGETDAYSRLKKIEKEITKLS